MNGLWLEYVRVFWPILGGIGAFLTLVGVLWLRTKFTPLEDHRALAVRVGTLETAKSGQEERLKHVEAHINQSPTRQELQDDIGDLGARMAGVEAGLRGVNQRLDTQNQYLHSLIEKGLGK